MLENKMLARDYEEQQKRIYLSSDANQNQPLQIVIHPVVDDLASVEAGVSIEDLLGRRVTLHRPVEYSLLGDERNGLDVDPLPEEHILDH